MRACTCFNGVIQIAITGMTRIHKHAFIIVNKDKTVKITMKVAWPIERIFTGVKTDDGLATEMITGNNVTTGKVRQFREFCFHS